ncbi:FRG domain-containing protein [Pseudomonas ficuserectae]|uniref:FRG domain-containing protein n=1 Tax=Pseudomonas ficuserectae TaxID=53410 RepID=UPI00211C654A|nr:FRG domain-containing protein [Pseudomonas ficuserectae]
MGTPIEMHFTNARELLDFVSPLNPIWDVGTHIFRGQSSQHKLTPFICRRGKGSFADGSPRKAFAFSYSDQVKYEITVIKQFLLSCDRSGLIVPGYTEETKSRITSDPGTFLSAHDPWPQRQVYEILAAAQHYGVPTRLLDWTERSFVSCYFAASGANFEVSSHDDRIAIWALDTSNSKHWKSVSIIRTPGGSSKNQAAQSGVFTTHKVSHVTYADFYQPEALEEVDEIYGPSGEASVLMKMTLPVREAPSLLRMCSKLGVDASTLFPGYQGVAQSVRDWAKMEIGIKPTNEFYNDYHGNQYDDRDIDIDMP